MNVLQMTITVMTMLSVPTLWVASDAHVDLDLPGMGSYVFHWYLVVSRYHFTQLVLCLYMCVLNNFLRSV